MIGPCKNGFLGPSVALDWHSAAADDDDEDDDADAEGLVLLAL